MIKYLKSKLSYLTSRKIILKYLSSSFLSLPVSLVTGFITFRTIDPYYMGIWGTVAIFETYSNFLRFGIVNGMNRELPFALGAGKKNEADGYIQTTLAYTIFQIFLFLAIIPFIITNFQLNLAYLSCIGVYIVRIILSFYTIYLTATFRSDDHFNKLSNIQFIMLGVTLLCSPFIFLGFNGFLIYQLLLVIINALLLHYYRPFHIKPKFSFSAFKVLFKIGVPLFITSYLFSFIDTFPRLYIINYGNEKMLGLYAPVLMLVNVIAMLPTILSAYMYPKFSFSLGKTNDPIPIWKKLKKIYVVSIIFILLIVISAFFLLDYFVVIFPKYRESLPYLKLSLLICPFVLYKLGNILNAIFKNYRYMIIYSLVYGVIQVLSLYLFSLYIKNVLDVVIYSQILTTFLLFLVSMLMNYRLIRNLSARQPVIIRDDPDIVSV